MGGTDASADAILAGAEDVVRRGRGQGHGAGNTDQGLQSIRTYNPEKPFTTWIYTIASRLCLDRLKRMSRIVAMPDDELVVRRFATESDSQRVLENQEWVSIVRTMAEGLSDKQRLVFTLCQLEGLSSEEAQEITGLDARQVKSNLYVARQTIRKRLTALGYE